MTDEKLKQLEQSLQEHIENMTSSDWHAWYENQYKEENFERANMELRMKMRLFKIQLKKQVANRIKNTLFNAPFLETDNKLNVFFTIDTNSKTTSGKVTSSGLGAINYNLAA